MSFHATTEDWEMVGSGQVYSVDLGSQGKIAVHGPDGEVHLPPIRTRGLNTAQKFAENFRVLLHGEDAFFDGFPALPVVTESSTIGTSGVEKEIMDEIISTSRFPVFKIDTRAVKNYRKDTVPPDADGRIPKCSDAEAARIIYHLAKENQDRLSVYTPERTFCEPVYTTVRPYDKRDYKDPFVESLIAKLPPYDVLPPDLQWYFGVNYSKHRGKAFVLAQSFDEKSASRGEWEKLVGLHGNGRKCHYRRNIEDIRQDVAKVLAGGNANNCDISREMRKESWKLTRRLLREFYHLAQGTYDPVKGTKHPVSGSHILTDLIAVNGIADDDDLFDHDA